MRNISKVILIGNLTRDPETRTAANNLSITTFGIATNREWVTKDSRKQDSTEFHDLVCFGHLAEFTAKNLNKGKLVYVEGYLKTRSWDDQSGVKKFRTEVVVEELNLLSKRQPSEKAQPEVLPYENIQPAVTIENPTAI